MKTYLAAAFAALLAWPVAAQSNNCAPREMVVERLFEKYGETRQSMGLGANNAIVEVFESLETGTWTVLVTSVYGQTCLVASGQAFEVDGANNAPVGDPT